ncbi:MAG: gamma-glutamyltransferase [Candidatus Hodarchaeales archaeon]|jgi:gamma-glutamyltranspeptidase/glutathione hydrolase
MAVNFWRRPLAGRSAVHAKNGLVASSQPLASSAGIQMLKAGGNACDAIIAMAAVLNIVEPFSTGIGGDAFALLYIPGEKSPLGINGSGFSPQKLTYDYFVNEKNLTEIPTTGILPITIPGAVSTWGLIHEKLGLLPWEEVLRPAINYAYTGFPVSPLIAQVWNELVPKLKLHEGARRTYLIDGERAPFPGETFKQEQIGKTFQQLATDGYEAFYQGDLANRTIEFLQKEGSVIDSPDLNKFSAEWTKPISKVIYDHRLWEHGPNGQGLVTLQILAIAEELDIARYPLNSAEYLHVLIEAKKLAFSDAFAYLADPEDMTVNVTDFLNDKYAHTRASQINSKKALKKLPYTLDMGNDTVYLTAIDKDGFAVSFINSLYYGFGSGIVDPITGIAFQNRGAGFTLQKRHPNQYKPQKRPYHTIIPAMITSSTSNQLLHSFGVMGGHHQPIGQSQVFLNLVLHNMDPQHAIDCPRFHHEQNSNIVALEEPIPIQVKAHLRKLGHNIRDSVGMNFGGGQIISLSEYGSYMGGSDSRKDGQAQGY